MKPFAVYSIVLFPFILFLSCELDDKNIVDNSSTPPYILDSYITPATINLAVLDRQKAFFDTSFIAYVALKDTDGLGDISAAYITILTPDNKELFYGTISDNGFDPDQKKGDGIYTSTINLQLSTTTIGTYSVKFHCIDKSGSVSTAAYQTITLFNADNHAPVISNLEMPDTVIISRDDETHDVKLSVKVDDQEGLVDIAMTYFTSMRPDGSIAGTYQMYDDGNKVIQHIFGGYSARSGDATADDGIYTVTIPITPDVAAPTYRDFTFQARDQSNVKSNSITQRIYLR